MTTHDDFDGRLTAWMDAIAPSAEPDSLLERVLERTAATSRRPAWAIPERWNPMTSITTQAATFGRVPWRTLVLAGLLIALLAGGLLLAGSTRRTPAPPFGPAANGSLVFSQDGDILAVDAPTGEARILIGGPTQDALPFFSPDGERFVFARGDFDSGTAEMWLADADGGSPRRLSDITSDTWADWSPDGDGLAVGGIGGDPSVITLVDADGGPSTTITTGLEAVELPIFRPPGGAAITFRGRDPNGDWGIYQIDRDGSDPVRLDLDAGFQGDPYYAENRDYYFQGFKWDAAGERLLFHTLEPAMTMDAGPTPGFRIHVASVDPTGVVVAEQTLEFDARIDDEFEVTLLPDGKNVLYQTIEGTDHRLMIAPLAPGAGAPRDLGVESIGRWIPYVVSPDGTQLVVQVPVVRSETFDPVALDLSTGAMTPIAIGDDVSWQRDAPRD